MSTERTGFTLLELCLALMIGLMLILLAVPSVAGLLAERRLKTSFEQFDRLAAMARETSIRERATYALVWEQDGIRLRRSDVESLDEGSGFTFQKGESFSLQRPAALKSNPGASWVFWSNGTCEPAVISFQGPAGSWQVRYDPLTARGVFERSSTP